MSEGQLIKRVPSEEFIFKCQWAKVCLSQAEFKMVKVLDLEENHITNPHPMPRSLAEHIHASRCCTE